MKVNWILGTTSTQERKDEIVSIIKSYDDMVTEIRPYDNIIKNIKDEDLKLPTVSLCSLQTATDILKTKLYPGVYCFLRNFKCSVYYPYYSKYLLNNPYCMMPYGHLLYNKDILFKWLGNNGCLFIRPDSGFKEFTGQVVDYGNYERDIKSLECFTPDDDLMCLISEPKNIEKEWRLVVANSKVVASSQYRNNGQHEEIEGCPDDILWFANLIVNGVNWEPNLCYTMDLCKLRNGDMKLIELNSFSCSGLYQCNLQNVVKEVREVVINDWKDVWE